MAGSMRQGHKGIQFSGGLSQPTQNIKNSQTDDAGGVFDAIQSSSSYIYIERKLDAILKHKHSLQYNKNQSRSS